MPVETPLTPIAHLKGRTDANGYLSVNLAAGSVTVSGADGSLLDGVDPAIKATVKDYANSNPLAVVVVDTAGTPVAGTGGGPATIADGADVTEGAIADVAVVGDNSGTISAKLRGLNKRIALNTDTGNNRFYVDGSGVTQPVSIATAPVLVAGTAIIGKVGIDQTTPGTTNAVAIISGQNGVAGGTGVDAATVQRVSLATNVALPAGTNVIGHVITDTGSTTTVTGTVTVGSHAVTNAGTFAVQESGTQVQVDDAAFTPATSKVSMVGAEFDDAAPDSVDEGDGGALRMSANRNLYVRIRDNAGNERGLNIDTNGALAATVTNATAANLNVTEASAAASLTSLQLIDDIVYTDDTSTHATGTSKGALFMAAATPTDTSVNANDIGAVAMTTDRKLHVSVQDSLPAGTAAIGKLAANAGVTIGAVEIAASQTLATVTTVSTVTTLTGGAVAHDGADSGNPIKVGFQAINALPAAVANADRSNATSDLWGRQLVSHIDPAMQVHKCVNYTSTQTGATIWDPTSGKKIAITSVVVGSYGTTAGRLILWFGDNGDTTYSAGTDQALFLASFAPSATVTPGLVFCPAVPIFCTTADRELHVTTSAGMSVDITIEGYEW